jgi:hypothetical protein
MLQVVPHGIDTRSGQDSPVVVKTSLVGPLYFKTMGIPLVCGRDIEMDDLRLKRAIVVVNRRFASEYFGTTCAAGKKISVPGQTPDSYLIVGTTADAAYESAYETPSSGAPVAFIPYSRFLGTGPEELFFEVRTKLTSQSLGRRIEALVQTVDSDFLVGKVSTQSDVTGVLVERQQTWQRLAGWCGVQFLFLTMVAMVSVLPGYRITDRSGPPNPQKTWSLMKRPAIVSILGAVLGIGGGATILRELGQRYGESPSFDGTNATLGALIALTPGLLAALLFALSSVNSDSYKASP